MKIIIKYKYIKIIIYNDILLNNNFKLNIENKIIRFSQTMRTRNGEG